MEPDPDGRRLKVFMAVTLARRNTISGCNDTVVTSIMEGEKLSFLLLKSFIRKDYIVFINWRGDSFGSILPEGCNNNANAATFYFTSNVSTY